MMRNRLFLFIGLLSSLLLCGCAEDNQSISYERVDMKKYTKIVYFRNCSVARSFNSSRIPVYSNGHIEFSNQKWQSSVINQMFNSVSIACAKKEIKLTKLPNFTVVDCFIEQIFYDLERKEAVMSFTINFAGQIKSFHIVQSLIGYSVLEKTQKLDTAEYLATGVVYDKNKPKLSEDELPGLFNLVFARASLKIAEFISKNIVKK